MTREAEANQRSIPQPVQVIFLDLKSWSTASICSKDFHEHHRSLTLTSALNQAYPLFLTPNSFLSSPHDSSLSAWATKVRHSGFIKSSIRFGTLSSSIGSTARTLCQASFHQRYPLSFPELHRTCPSPFPPGPSSKLNFAPPRLGWLSVKSVHHKPFDALLKTTSSTLFTFLSKVSLTACDSPRVSPASCSSYSPASSEFASIHQNLPLIISRFIPAVIRS